MISANKYFNKNLGHKSSFDYSLTLIINQGTNPLLVIDYPLTLIINYVTIDS
jgi:hypothetical protein